jgi:hypothetical protein
MLAIRAKIFISFFRALSIISSMTPPQLAVNKVEDIFSRLKYFSN